MSFNYPYYNPYMPSAGGPGGFQQTPRPEMMQGYPQMPQTQPGAAQSQIQGFSARPVTSREEAVAVQVDFMGPGTLMPDLKHGAVYLKRFNLDTGACDFMTFALQGPESETPAVEYATKNDLREMQDVIQGLAADLERLRQPVRGGKRIDPEG